jgi:hypothetical protein
VGGETILLGYTKMGLSVLKSTADGEVDSFTDFGITNNITSPYELELKYAINRPLYNLDGEIDRYVFTVMNVAPEGGGNVYTDNFRVKFRCYISIDGIEYTSSFALSDIVAVYAGYEEIITASFISPVANVNWSKQHEVTIYYDSGDDTWVQLGTKMWNEGL